MEVIMHEAKKAYLAEFSRAVRDGDGWPGEADNDLNDACRALIGAVRDTCGEAWLGRINLYGEERHGVTPYLWRWDGSTVLNFSCAFVLPAHDAELERMIKERDDAPYTTTADDCVRVDAIMERIYAAGGHHLFWT